MLVKELIISTLLLSVIKKQVGLGCKEGSIRLAGNGSKALQGRVEVCLGSVWGTVCDDYWDIFDATVVCRQLGHDVVGVTGQFGGGSGRISLDNVACYGSESRLLECRFDEHHNCHHYEDAGVICTARVHINIQLNAVNSTALMIQWRKPNTAPFIRSYEVTLSYEEELFDQLYYTNTTTEVVKTSLVWPQSFSSNTMYTVCVQAIYLSSSKLTKSCKNWEMPQSYEKSSLTNGERRLVVIIVILTVLTVLLFVLLIMVLIYPSCIRPLLETTEAMSRVSRFLDKHVYKVPTGSIQQQNSGTSTRRTRQRYGFLEFSPQEINGDCSKVKEDPVYAVLQSTEESHQCKVATPPAEPYEVPRKLSLNKKDTDF